MNDARGFFVSICMYIYICISFSFISIKSAFIVRTVLPGKLDCVCASNCCERLLGTFADAIIISPNVTSAACRCRRVSSVSRSQAQRIGNHIFATRNRVVDQINLIGALIHTWRISLCVCDEQHLTSFPPFRNGNGK